MCFPNFSPCGSSADVRGKLGAELGCREGLRVNVKVSQICKFVYITHDLIDCFCRKSGEKLCNRGDKQVCNIVLNEQRVNDILKAGVAAVADEAKNNRDNGVKVHESIVELFM